MEGYLEKLVMINSEIASKLAQIAELRTLKDRKEKEECLKLQELTNVSQKME
jgi:hypothetical protein